MTWDSDPADFMVDVAEDMKSKRDEIALYALRGLFFRTPEDTGRARNGWTISTGSVRTEDRGTGPKPTLREGQAEIARARPYTILYVANAVEYVPYLEYGTRRMRPFAMMATVFNDIRVNYT